MPSTTLSALTTRVYNRLDNNTQLYNQTEITLAINESIRCINLATGYIQTTQALVSRAGQVWYDVPLGILIPLRLQFEGTFLERTSVVNLGSTTPQWPQESTGSTGTSVSHWLTNGLLKFAIHPADSVGGNMIQVTGVAEPVQLTLPTDIANIPDEYTEMIEDMSVVTLALKESGKIFSDASSMYQGYLSKLKKMTMWQHARWPAYYVEELQEK